MLGFLLTRLVPLVLVLADSKMPGLEQATANPTPKSLTLEEIELAVAQTLEAEGSQGEAPEATDTPTSDLLPSPIPSEPQPTPTGTAQPRCTVFSNALNLRYRPGLVYAPPLRCEGSFEIRYALKLNDSSGRSITANTTAKVVWIC